MATDDEIRKGIEEFENRKIYRELNETIIANIDDDQLEQAILDHIWEHIDDDYKNAHKIVTGLHPSFSAIYTTWHVEAEVCNGGFNQYFWNSSGEFCLEAIQGFLDIEANEYSKLMKKAVTVAIKEMPEMDKFRKVGTIEAFSESYKHTSLNELDEIFYSCTEDLPQLRLNYIRSHASNFISAV